MKRIFSFSFELWMFKLIYVVPLGGLLTWLVFGGRDLILKVKMGSKTVNFDVSCFVMHFLCQFWAHDKKRYLCYVFRYDLRLIKFWRRWPYFWGRNRVTNFDICIILSCIMLFIAQFLVYGVQTDIFCAPRESPNLLSFWRSWPNFKGQNGVTNFEILLFLAV